MGQVELATSPYLPSDPAVAVRFGCASAGAPGAPRPRERFVRPGDATLQIDRAIAFHEATFGSRPSGMWPSEGSVSDEAVALIAAAGLRWIATDEDILSRSLNAPLGDRPDLLYRPYRIGDTRPGRAVSRPRAVGPHWLSLPVVGAAARRPPISSGRVREAGRRFIASHRRGSRDRAGDPRRRERLGALRRRRPPFPSRAVPALQEAPDIQTVTMSEAAAGPARPLPSIFPGLLDQRRLLHLDRPPRRPSRMGSAFGCAAAPSTNGRRSVPPDGPGPGARGTADRRRQRLVLVVRRRPLLGPRRRVRRPLSPASPQRLHRARAGDSRGAVRDQHQHGCGT